MHNEDLFGKFIEKMDAAVDNKDEIDIGISTLNGNEFQILMSPTDYDIFSDHGMDIYGNRDQLGLFWHRCGSVTPTFPYAA